jgi:hypothetical protein
MPSKAKKKKAPGSKTPGRGLAARRLELDFPAKMVTKPFIYDLVKKFDLVPNIRRANITQKFGYIQLELLGSQAALDKGIAWLIKQGVGVEPIVKDVLES